MGRAVPGMGGERTAWFEMWRWGGGCVVLVYWLVVCEPLLRMVEDGGGGRLFDFGKCLDREDLSCIM